MSRPKRKSRAATIADATDAPSPTAAVPSDNDSDVLPVTKRRKTTKRAPTTRNRKPNDGPPALNNMPLDIYYEICATLEPMDVLSLSRTSSYIYHTLMADGSSGIWKKSLSLMSGIPDRPSDLTEAEYARLLFGTDCYRCLKRPVNVHTAWSGRFRICATCVNLVYAPTCSLPYNLRPYVPVVITGNKKSHTTSSYYYQKTVAAWQKEYNTADNKDEWLQKKINEQKSLSVHQEQCRKWASSWEAELVNRRKQKIVAHIKALGWGSELAKIRYTREQPQNLEKVIKACQKEVTERDLLKLEPYINDYMTNLQAKRIERERDELATNTRRVLEDVITTWTATIPPNVFAPSVGDLAALPIVQDMCNDATRTPDPKTELQVLREQFPEITAQLVHEMEEELRGLVRSACGESYEFDSKTVLNLATTVFRCQTCVRPQNSANFMWYRRIAVHAHCERGFDIDKCRRWNQNGTITFQKEDMLILSKILSQSGFDPNVTTISDMDAADPIFECLTCNSQHVGRCTMRWAMLTEHIAQCHSGPGSPTPDLILLEGAEAAKVVHRLDEKLARYRAEVYAMFCAHCKNRGSSVTIEEHVRSAHGINNPTEVDIVADLNWHVENLHRLWPPREEVDEEALPSVVPPV